MILKNYRPFNTIIAIFLLFFTTYLWFTIHINQDAAYYLGVARDISSGDVMYKDVFNAYSPVSMYFNAIWYRIIENPPFHLFIYSQLCIIFFIGYIYYKILIKQNHSQGMSLFMGLVFIFSILELDGTSINLEVFCILFLMLAYLFLLYKQYFLTGCAIAMCVFSKQYGALNVLPFMLLVIFSHQEKVKKLKPVIQLMTGGISILGIFILYYVMIKDIALSDLISQLSGKSYAKHHFTTDINLISFVEAKISWILIILTIYLSRKKAINKVSLILLFGFIINLLPLFIKVYPHYFLLSLPYAFLLFGHNVQYFTKLSISIFFLLFMLFNLKFIYNKYQFVNVYKQQVKIAQEVEKIYPKGSQLFLDGSIRYLYILNDYKNPLKKELGYTFEYDLDTINTNAIKILNYKELIKNGIIEEHP